MKCILMTADTIGGVWTYSLELAGELSKQGIEVALATMGTPMTPQQHEAASKIPNLQIFESNFKLEWMEDVSASGEWLLQLEERIQTDVVHLNGYIHGALPWKTPTVLVGHSCVLSWWEAVKGEAAPSSWNKYKVEVTRGIQAADIVVAPSLAMLAALNRHYGEIQDGRVIPNGRDINAFCTREKNFYLISRTLVG